MMYKCEQLARLMADSVYPRIIELLSHTGQKELKVTLGEGFCDITLNVSGEIKKLNTDNTVRRAFEPYQEKGICPIFQSYTDSASYIHYCNFIMDTIPPLEKEVAIIDKTLERASHIGVTYERKILIEKIVTSHQ